MSLDVHALVPLKRLLEAKTRLAGVLLPPTRAQLMVAMLDDVVCALVDTPSVARVTLVSSDPRAADLAAHHGIGWWDDRRLPWNAAVATAMGELEPSDPRCGIAIARALDGGTNAVAMRPPGVEAEPPGRTLEVLTPAPERMVPA